MPRAKSFSKNDNRIIPFFERFHARGAAGQDRSSERGTRGHRGSSDSGGGLHRVQNAEVRVTEAPDGTIVNRVMVKRTKGGGPQYRMAATNPSEKVTFRVRTTNTADRATVGDVVQKASGAKAGYADIYPVHDNNAPFGHRPVNFQTRWAAATSGPAKKESMQSHFAKAKEKLAKECANCKSLDHKVAHCLWAPQGTIKACPVCPNNGTHLADTCETFDQLSIKEKVQLLVVSRGNMPAYKTRTSWYSYLEEYMKTPGAEMPGSFPWTPSYAKAVLDDVAQLQKEFDRTRDYSHLPVDPDDPKALVQCTPAKFEGPPKRQLREDDPEFRGDLSTAPEMFDDEMTDVGALAKDLPRGFYPMDVESHDN
ncbi:hypothetical protein EDB80DRAFT_812923 [Ilyonectria destructans]|nr:hypothetical protein EDB80DRAFT_812923 [Ilyonectria destructans]